MVLLSEGSSVKESPEDKQSSAPCVRGSTFTWGPIFSVKSGPVPGFSGGSEYSVTLGMGVSGTDVDYQRHDDRGRCVS